MNKIKLSMGLAIAFLTVGSCEVFAQANFAVNPDNPIYSTNVACTTGSACTTGIFPFASMGNGSTNYELQYANSGAFKTEWAGQERMTWVTDYEMNDWYNPKRSIAHWDHASGGTTFGYTELNVPYNADEDEWDPDVVQWEDRLFAVYYSIEYANTSQFGFPGNGNTSISDYRVRLEEFTATDNPVSSNNWEIHVTPTAFLEYSKSPNIDVNLVGDVVMAWEEYEGGSYNHIYAKAWDPVNGLYNSTHLDLYADDLDFDMIYNPDITVTTIDDDEVDPDEYPVYITFIGLNHSGITLNVYHSTVGELKNGATASTTQLTTLATLYNHANVAVGDPVRDYLYRPRIAAHPQVQWVSTGGSSGFTLDQYNVVVPNMNVGYGTDIVSYTVNGSSTMSTIHTQLPASIVNTNNSSNYEPLTEVNNGGYEVVWINDQMQALSGWSGVSPLANGMSGALGGFFEQTILRKRIDWGGTSMYANYSIVPDVPQNCCWTYAPSIAYDRQQVLIGPTGPNAFKTFFGFQYDFYDQKTMYKLSTYTNTSMKFAGQSSISQTDDALSDIPVHNGNNQWTVNLMDDDINHWQVMDMQGRPVYVESSSDVNSNQIHIDLNSQAAGIYLLRIGNERMSTTHKILRFE